MTALNEFKLDYTVDEINAKLEAAPYTTYQDITFIDNMEVLSSTVENGENQNIVENLLINPILYLDATLKYDIIFNGTLYEDVSFIDTNSQSFGAVNVLTSGFLGELDQNNELPSFTNYPFFIGIRASSEEMFFYLYVSGNVVDSYFLTITAKEVPFHNEIDAKYLNNSPGKIVFTENSDGGMNKGEVFNWDSNNSSIEATGHYSHAEGYYTFAEGDYSHAEGNESTASGVGSHAEGVYCWAWGNGAHAEGNTTTAKGFAQHVQGTFNIIDNTASTENAKGKYLHIVGNGKAATRSNAYTLDWDGNGWFQGTCEATALILKSSTSGSSKRFKITVDDNGNLSATAL